MSDPAKDIADTSSRFTVISGGGEKPEQTTFADVAMIFVSWFTIAWFISYPIAVSIVSGP